MITTPLSALRKGIADQLSRGERPKLAAILRTNEPKSLRGWVDLLADLGTLSGSSANQLVLKSFASWCREQKNALDVMMFALPDHKVSVWAACACVETVMKHIPAREKRPQRAIDTAREWVLGRATKRECIVASDAANSAADAAYDAIDASIASYDEYGAYYSARAAHYVAAAAANDADAPNDAVDAVDAVRTATAERTQITRMSPELCIVIADAVENFPLYLGTGEGRAAGSSLARKNPLRISARRIW